MSGRIEFLSILICWTLSWSFLKISSTSAFWILWYLAIPSYQHGRWQGFAPWTFISPTHWRAYAGAVETVEMPIFWKGENVQALKISMRLKDVLPATFVRWSKASILHSEWVLFVILSFLETGWGLSLVKGSWTNRRPWRPARSPKAPCEAGGIWMLKKLGIFAPTSGGFHLELLENTWQFQYIRRNPSPPRSWANLPCDFLVFS